MHSCISRGYIDVFIIRRYTRFVLIKFYAQTKRLHTKLQLGLEEATNMLLLNSIDLNKISFGPLSNQDLGTITYDFKDVEGLP